MGIVSSTCLLQQMGNASSSTLILTCKLHLGKWVTLEAPGWPHQPQDFLVSLWPEGSDQTLPETKGGFEPQKGHCDQKLLSYCSPAQSSGAPFSLCPSLTAFLFKMQQILPVITSAPPHSSKSAFVQETKRPVFSSLSVAQERGKERLAGYLGLAQGQ